MEIVERPRDWTRDSGMGFIQKLNEIAQKDAEIYPSNAVAHIATDDATGLTNAAASYGDSWKKRGGVGAFMMLARKWDRMEHRARKAGVMIRPIPYRADLEEELIEVQPYDILLQTIADGRGEGLLDDIRDLRRYLLLVEAELLARGFSPGHRDNAAASK